MNRPKYDIISIEDIVKATKEIAKNHDEIQLFFLYGSYANNSQSEYSDIDIAVFLDNKFREKPLYSSELSIEFEYYIASKVNIDLRIINNTTPRFLFNLIKNSMCLFAKNQHILNEFEIRVLFNYQDIKPMLDRNDRIEISKVIGN
ncbi:MAG: type VII toxin-antitoxin system MntA family adenylyltransferase antitoxin [Promethearchaeota archaeon]